MQTGVGSSKMSARANLIHVFVAFRTTSLVYDGNFIFCNPVVIYVTLCSVI